LPTCRETNDSLAGHWGLDPAVTFLNHGSFGACPVHVLELQSRLRAEMEREPVSFLYREFEARWDAARNALSEFLRCDADGLVFVPNATAGVNTVLRSLRLGVGDELLVTDQEYNACRNALEAVAAQVGARVVVASVPFPASSADQVTGAVLSKVTGKTRLLLVDHVTSQTALVNPVERLVRELEGRGVEVLVDGAHAPGMLPLDLSALGAPYYTGNCHKWLCAPKGAAFLYVREDRRRETRPLIVSHGANSPRDDRSRFLVEFSWTGTHDPTPYLCIPECIRFLGGLLPGGWPELMRRNHDLAVEAQAILCERLQVPPPCPPEMIGSMAAVPLPDAASGPLKPPLYFDPLQDALLERYRIEVPVIPWPAWPSRLVRASAQLYNRREEYGRLAAALGEVLGSP
jgi:isopenicillin-N epimerase